ncbi:putative adenylate kinase [Trypanosoma theileri]|uniref:Putative adenylate kinase n=1 Tax=Trypanosoma theileri TaxID=67003 RepID=A0A1X0P8P5_9TRYP|nr:putative adenylate kinase [Trypanosoma theileri]ORC93238.1 putative adenylate kinase [Trypanosoma theileri]
MHVFLLGPPGSGKTSIGTVLKERYGVCHVTPNEAVSHAVENNRTVISEKLRHLLNEGKPIPDWLLTRVVADAIRGPDCINGFLLDDFPKTAAQARLLNDEGVKPDAIVLLNIADRVLIDRYSGRWVHSASGRIYHTLYNPPKVKGRDDVTGQPLVQRAEDTEDAVRQRLAKFQENLSEIKLVYEKEELWHTVNGYATLDTIDRSICRVLDPIIAAKHRRWWSKLFSWRK